MQKFAIFYSRQCDQLVAARAAFDSVAVEPEYKNKVTRYVAEHVIATSKNGVCYDHSIYQPSLNDEDRHFAWPNSIVHIDLEYHDRNQPAIPMQGVQVRLSHRPVEMLLLFLFAL